MAGSGGATSSKGASTVDNRVQHGELGDTGALKAKIGYAELMQPLSAKFCC